MNTPLSRLLHALLRAALVVMPVVSLACGGPDFKTALTSDSGGAHVDAGADVDYQPIIVYREDAAASPEATPGDTQDGSVDATLDGPSPHDGGLDTANDAPVPEGSACSGLQCDGGCVPNDPHNCGTCGHDCAALPNVVSAGVSCAAGACVYRCAVGYADCSDAGTGCSASLSQNGNCGACGVTCTGPTPVCSASGCTSNCGSATPTLCGSSCANTQSDPQNCGGCGTQCASGTTCAAGQCVCNPSSCPGGCCSGNTCVGTSSQTNPATTGCGTGGSACTACPVTGQTCVGGACACPAGSQKVCGGACVDLSGNGNNCGACGHSCQTWQCIAGKCQPVILASNQGTPWGIAVGASNVYWVNKGIPGGNGGSIFELTVATGTFGPLTITTSRNCAAFASGSVTVDATYVYWTSNAACKIPLAGGADTDLGITGIYSSALQSIAVNSTDIYVLDPGDNLIGSTTQGNYVYPATTTVAGIAADNDGIYWLETPQGTSGSIMQHPPVGLSGGLSLPLASGFSFSDGIAVYNHRVYWTNTTGTIMAIGTTPVGGAQPSTIATGQTNPSGIAVDASGAYWTNGDGTVAYVPAAGGAVVPLATGQSGPRGIALDANTVYWTNSTGGQVMKVAK